MLIQRWLQATLTRHEELTYAESFQILDIAIIAFFSQICINLSTFQSDLSIFQLFNTHYCIKINENKLFKLLRAYQDWLELVDDLVEIWSRSGSGLTQIWLNTLFLPQHSFLSSTSCSSTSSSFRVTNTSLSSLAQSLNIT